MTTEKKQDGREYELRDDGGASETVIAASMVEAEALAEDWARDGEWGDDHGTLIATVHITSDTGEKCVVDVIISATEPDCDGGQHDWQSPAWLGGLKENPGVWGHGAGICSVEVCALCGVYHHLDTAHDDGHGATMRYEEYAPADERSEAWVAEQREDSDEGA